MEGTLSVKQYSCHGGTITASADCEMIEVMEQNRELIHDTKHHFLVVQKEHLKNEEYENLQKYIKQISDEFQRTVPCSIQELKS